MISKLAKRFCRDLTKIENYDEAVNDKLEIWACHHRLEQVFTKKELVRAGWYYDRKPQELIFLKRSEHNGNPDIHISVKTRIRNSKGKPSGMKGKTAWNKGKKMDDDFRKKVSESMKGRTHTSTLKGKSWKLVEGKRVWF